MEEASYFYNWDRAQRKTHYIIWQLSSWDEEKRSFSVNGRSLSKYLNALRCCSGVCTRLKHKVYTTSLAEQRLIANGDCIRELDQIVGLLYSNPLLYTSCRTTAAGSSLWVSLTNLYAHFLCRSISGVLKLACPQVEDRGRSQDKRRMVHGVEVRDMYVSRKIKPLTSNYKHVAFLLAIFFLLVSWHRLTPPSPPHPPPSLHTKPTQVTTKCFTFLPPRTRITHQYLGKSPSRVASLHKT